MKVSILVILIVVPMLASIGLYCYSFISTRWSYLDETSLAKYTTFKTRQRLTSSHISLQIQNIRHAFRSRYGLFGYCLDYRWIDLLVPKSSSATNENDPRSESTLFCRRCSQPIYQCPDLAQGCCVSKIFFD